MSARSQGKSDKTFSSDYVWKERQQQKFGQKLHVNSIGQTISFSHGCGVIMPVGDLDMDFVDIHRCNGREQRAGLLTKF